MNAIAQTLSEYAQQKALDTLRYYDLTDFDSFLEPFLDGKIDRYGPWHDHVAGWLESSLAKDGNLLVIRFEDLRQNTENLLVSVVEFLGMGADRDAIRQAIANNTVDRMRAKEDVSKVVVRGPGEEGRFVRRGSVGGWRELMNPMQLERIGRYAGGMLARLGYPPCKSAAQETIPRGKARASAG